MKHQHQQKKTNICTQKSGEAPLGGKEEEETKNKREEDGKDWDVRCDFGCHSYHPKNNEREWKMEVKRDNRVQKRSTRY